MKNRNDAGVLSEVFDGKLLLILFIRRIPMLLGSCLAGALLVCGIYICINLPSHPQSYSVTSRYKVAYGTDPQTDNEYTYINKATWNTWVTTDYFVALVMDREEAQGLSADYIAGCLSADLETDLRMPNTKATAESGEMAERLDRAVQAAILEFGRMQPEIEEITWVDTTEVKKEARIPRVPQALILGALLGLLTGACILVFKFFLEEAAYVPDTLENRFGIPTVAVRDLRVLRPVLTSEELALMSFEEIAGLKELSDSLSAQCDVKVNTAKIYEAGVKMQGSVVVAVKAGRDNGRGLYKLLKEVELSGGTVKAMILVDTDDRLLKRYYGKRWEA